MPVYQKQQQRNTSVLKTFVCSSSIQLCKRKMRLISLWGKTWQRESQMSVYTLSENPRVDAQTSGSICRAQGAGVQCTGSALRFLLS